MKCCAPGLSEVSEEGAEESSTMQPFPRVQRYSGPEEPLHEMSEEGRRPWEYTGYTVAPP